MKRRAFFGMTAGIIGAAVLLKKDEPVLIDKPFICFSHVDFSDKNSGAYLNTVSPEIRYPTVAAAYKAARPGSTIFMLPEALG